MQLPGSSVFDWPDAKDRRYFSTHHNAAQRLTLNGRDLEEVGSAVALSI